MFSSKYHLKVVLSNFITKRELLFTESAFLAVLLQVMLCLLDILLDFRDFSLR